MVTWALESAEKMEIGCFVREKEKAQRFQSAQCKRNQTALNLVKMDRLSPPSDSSPSNSDVDEPMFESEEPVVYEEPLSPPPDVRGIAQSGSNKRRAPAGLSQPNVKTRSRRGDDQRNWNAASESGNQASIRRGAAGPDGRKEELVDIELAKHLRKGMTLRVPALHDVSHFLTTAIGDPFDESITQNVAR